MPDIRSGLEVEGEPVGGGGLSDAEFNALVQAGAKSEREDAPSAPHQSVDPGADSSEAVIAQVLNPEVTPAIRDGLTVHDRTATRAEPAPEPRHELSPENRRLVEKAAAELETEKDDREELALRRFFERAADASDEEVIDALVDLRVSHPDTAESVMYELTAARSGVDPTWDEGDAHAMEAFASTFEQLAERVDQEAEFRTTSAQLAEVRERIATVSEETAKQHAAQTKQLVREFASERRLTKDGVAEVERFAAELGWNLPAVFAQDPQEGRRLLEASWATMREARNADISRRANQAILDAPSTSVRSGLSQFGPLGWEPLDAPDLSVEEGPVRLNPKRIADRMTYRRARPEDIRREVARPERASIKNGLTAGGRAISMDDASGATERHRQAEAERRARTIGYLR